MEFYACVVHKECFSEMPSQCAQSTHIILKLKFCTLIFAICDYKWVIFAL